MRIKNVVVNLLHYRRTRYIYNNNNNTCWLLQLTSTTGGRGDTIRACTHVNNTISKLSVIHPTSNTRDHNKSR